MQKIKKAIAISDLHLGSHNCYLHKKYVGHKSMRKKLLKLLQDLGPQDELILNGDVLDLSQAGWDEIITEGKEFFKIIADAGPYGRIVFIPGNHDHHIWRVLGEKIWIDDEIKQGRLPPAHFEYPKYFVDKSYSTKKQTCREKILLIHLWPAGKSMPEMVIKYPHHLIRISSKSKPDHNYFITHGHYLEDLFKPINYLIESEKLEELEAFNNLWLEAFDYDLGHAGRLSERIRKLLDGFHIGEKPARKEMKTILKAVYKNIIKTTKPGLLGRIGLWLAKWFAYCKIKKFTLKDQHGLRNVLLDDKIKTSIIKYLNKYILPRYVKGNETKHLYTGKGTLPRPFTFIFGHTHRPIFNADQNKTRVEIDGKIYPVMNTGGWLPFEGTKEYCGNAGVLVMNAEGVSWKPL